MQIEILEYIIYGVCFVVWLASIIRTLDYRRIVTKVDQARTTPITDEPLPAFSVIVTARNQCDALRRNLPLMLNQIYPNFEVIVVDVNSNDSTKQLLEELEEDNMKLRHTFTPATSRDISAQRLAITLGVKAATHPWVVITQADCCPISHQWLRRLGESIASHRSAKMTLGYTRFNKAEDYTERRMRFFRFWQQMLTLNYTPQNGAYQCDGCNLVYNKELFLSHNGFASHSTLLTGATDIMVNQHSTKHNTAVCLHQEGFMEQIMPSHKHWKQDRRFFQETRRHFSHTVGYRLRYAGSVLLHALLVLMLSTSIGFSIWQGNYIITGAVLVLWIIHFITQGVMLSAAYKALEDKTLNYFSIAWYIHLIPFWDTYAWIRHATSDKRQYRKKYI